MSKSLRIILLLGICCGALSAQNDEARTICPRTVNHNNIPNPMPLLSNALGYTKRGQGGKCSLPFDRSTG